VTGSFITFEGGEGAGKSTQIARLRRRIEAAGQPVLVTREPGGSPRAERIRKFLLAGGARAHGPLAEAVLFTSARIDHLERTIRPALGAGTHVLCDRFADSTRAYQGALGSLDEATLAGLERVAVGETVPDLTLVLDLPPETGLERVRRRQAERGEGADRFETEGLPFHVALREAFLRIAAGAPQRCVVIDAGRDEDAVEAAIWRAVQERLPRAAGGAGSARHGA
jgi:dTMP kinase